MSDKRVYFDPDIHMIKPMDALGYYHAAQDNNAQWRNYLIYLMGNSDTAHQDGMVAIRQMLAAYKKDLKWLGKLIANELQLEYNKAKAKEDV